MEEPKQSSGLYEDSVLPATTHSNPNTCAGHPVLTVNSIKLETGLRPNSAGIPYTLLLRTEAIGFPTFGLLLYNSPMNLQVPPWISGFGRSQRQSSPQKRHSHCREQKSPGSTMDLEFRFRVKVPHHGKQNTLNKNPSVQKIRLSLLRTESKVPKLSNSRCSSRTETGFQGA